MKTFEEKIARISPGTLKLGLIELSARDITREIFPLCNIMRLILLLY